MHNLHKFRFPRSCIFYPNFIINHIGALNDVNAQISQHVLQKEVGLSMSLCDLSREIIEDNTDVHSL